MNDAPGGRRWTLLPRSLRYRLLLFLLGYAGLLGWLATRAAVPRAMGAVRGRCVRPPHPVVPGPPDGAWDPDTPRRHGLARTVFPGRPAPACPSGSGFVCGAPE